MGTKDPAFDQALRLLRASIEPGPPAEMLEEPRLGTSTAESSSLGAAALAVWSEIAEVGAEDPDEGFLMFVGVVGYLCLVWKGEAMPGDADELSPRLLRELLHDRLSEIQAQLEAD
jgi:hypothetical protein